MASSPEIKHVRVRMAPSPTGFLHIGTARVALFNWLFARHNQGTFVLRIEDTDQERSKPEHETGLIKSLQWLGLNWAEGPDIGGPYGPYRQSERGDIYRRHLETLLTNGSAYYCYCTKEELEAVRKAQEAAKEPLKYSGKCRDRAASGIVPEASALPPVIRLKIPEEKVAFNDIVRDTVEFDGTLLGDIVIARNIDDALFHFAVVIDDYEMKITHVIRGEDHIANTPKHILIQRALGFPQPIYAHLPLVLNSNRSKMSKRNNEASFDQYPDQGYLPETMLNFLALLGWHPKGNEEVLSAEQIVEQFELGDVQKAGAIFDSVKLQWLNAQHVKRLSDAELIEKLQPFLKKAGIEAPEPFIAKVAKVERERMKTLGEFVENAAFFFKLPDYDAALLVWKTDDTAQTKAILEEVGGIIKELPEDLAKDQLLTALDPLIQKYSKGSVLWPLRVALSGQKTSPDPLEIAEILGLDETLKRVSVAIKKLS